MYSAERMSGAGKQVPTSDVSEDEEVTQSLKHPHGKIKKAHYPTAEDGQVPTQVTTGASGGYMRGSNVTGVHYGDNVTLNVRYGCTHEDLDYIKRLQTKLETTFSSLRSAQTSLSPVPLNSKKQDLKSGEDNTDEGIMGGVRAEHEDWSEMTDDELYVHLHQCDMSDVRDEDIQSLTDEEVYSYVVDVLASCNIRTSESVFSSDTFGIKMRAKARQRKHKKDSPSAETEETISDVKLKSCIKGGSGSRNSGTDLLGGVNAEKQMDDCTSAEGGHLNALRPGKCGDDSSPAYSGRKQLKADSAQNADYSESLREGCTKGDNPNMAADMLLPSPVHPLNGLPGNYLEFTFDLRCIQARPVRIITRQNVEKTVEIGKLHPLKIVNEVFTFLDVILTELDPQSEIRFESGFYAAHPESVSEVLRIDLTDIHNLVVRIKTKLNVELILQISAMKPPAAWFKRIDTFLTDMLLKDC